MAKTTVEVDSALLSKAHAILGTSTAEETVDAALQRVVVEAARAEFLELAAARAKATTGLGTRIRSYVAAVGGVDLELPERNGTPRAPESP